MPNALEAPVTYYNPPIGNFSLLYHDSTSQWLSDSGTTPNKKSQIYKRVHVNIETWFFNLWVEMIKSKRDVHL